MSRYLVVDESPVIQKVAARILSDAGVEVTAATSLAEAARLTADQPPFDLVLVSAAVPDGTPDAFTRELRQRPAYARLPIFVSISETSLGLMTRCRRAGATGFVFRPFDRAALLQWLAPYLPGKAAA